MLYARALRNYSYALRDVLHPGFRELFTGYLVSEKTSSRQLLNSSGLYNPLTLSSANVADRKLAFDPLVPVAP